MEWYVLIAITLFLGLISWQGIALLAESQDKSKKYKAARASAMAIGKPLLVVGGPLGVSRRRHFFRLMAHGQGDVCLDIDPRALKGCSCGVVADVRRIPFADKSFGAVFVSHVLEHLPSVADAQEALAELDRVAGAVFAAYPNRHYIVAWLIPGHHLWIWYKDGRSYLRERRQIQKVRAGLKPAAVARSPDIEPDHQIPVDWQ